MKDIKIYQIKDTENCNYSFMGWRFASRYFNMNDYELVYSYKEEDPDLEEIFFKFNIERPEDFTGHSLSVSDIVEVGNKKYYVDSFGFKEID